jgi:hypothetical protein
VAVAALENSRTIRDLRRRVTLHVIVVILAVVVDLFLEFLSGVTDAPSQLKTRLPTLGVRLESPKVLIRERVIGTDTRNWKERPKVMLPALLDVFPGREPLRLIFRPNRALASSIARILGTSQVRRRGFPNGQTDIDQANTG